MGFEERLRAALSLELPYSPRAKAGDGAMSAVLALFGAPSGGEREACLLLTRRTEHLEKHAGQMAFPGGVSDAADADDPSRTALRETQEEVGISPERVQVIGRLPPLSTLTGYQIDPVVGWLRSPIDEVALLPNEAEIDRCLWIPVSRFAESGVYRTEWLTHGSVRYALHAYQVDEYRIWGATAAMIKNLLDRFGSLG